MASKAKKILLIEDSTTDSFLIQRIMREYPSFISHQIVVKNSMADAICYLKANANDMSLILLDLGLPDTANGHDSFAQLTEANLENIPTIALTSIENRDLAVSLMKQGLEDYVCKSDVLFAPEMLGKAIDFALSRHVQKQSSVRAIMQALDSKNSLLEAMWAH